MLYTVEFNAHRILGGTLEVIDDWNEDSANLEGAQCLRIEDCDIVDLDERIIVSSEVNTEDARKVFLNYYVETLRTNADCNEAEVLRNLRAIELV